MGTPIETLRPWLESEKPNGQGEIGMFCPMHDDQKRSASINFGKGVYNCQKCGGGPIRQLVAYIEQGEIFNDRRNGHGSRHTGAHHNNGGSAEKAPLNEGQVAGWHSALLSREEELERLMESRGLKLSTIENFQIGWNSSAGRTGAYTIPVREFDGGLANVRFYQLNPADDRRKIWGLPGRNAPMLFPGPNIADLDHTVIICEGEWDCLVTRQNTSRYGFDVVTRTGAAKVWESRWNSYFAGKNIYVCHDADETGKMGNRIVASALEGVAAEVYCVHLPYEIEEKHGKDLTDFWLEGYTAQDFYEMLMEAEPWAELDDSAIEVVDATVLQSFDSRHVGHHMRMQVTITGKRDPAYLLPKNVDYRCGKDAGVKCVSCPMNDEGYDGKHSLTISSDDPMLLKMMNASDQQVSDLLRSQVTPVKCGRLSIEAAEMRSVEELYVRPSVDHYRISAEAGDFTSRKIISVDRHDTMPNNTVEVVGTIYPAPRSQHNEFQAWEVNRTQTSVDHFEMTDEIFKALEKFQPSRLTTPMKRLGIIADDLSKQVTGINSRPEMHALMDLTFHSAVGYYFDGKQELKGWLDVLILGDTRTGKTAAAKSLIQWYGAGEYVSCEAATFAGVVGGVQQYGGKEWVVTWGAIPINDRRLVALDEVSGLSVDQIAQMSSIRSSGEAQLTKIHSESTLARTRLLWMANPRNGGSMRDFTYGINALGPLIGKNEDVARFDLAMSVANGEVDADEINSTHPDYKPKFSQQQYQWLLHWAWSRKPGHIRWQRGVEQYVFQESIAMGQRYISNPPLVQVENIREKICRVAVALAIRLFSTKDGEHVLVRKEHVRDAVKFMDRLYGMRGFGYGQVSQQHYEDLRIANDSKPAAVEFLRNHRPLALFLRDQTEGTFQRSALQEALNITTEEGNAIVSQLFDWRMLRRMPDKGLNKTTPELNEVIREVFE